MPRVNLSDYRNIALQGNLSVRQDLGTGDLKISRNNPLNRIIQWFKVKVSPKARRQVAEGYARFFEAVRSSPEHGSYAGRVEDFLKSDLASRKPLSSRKISQALDRLDSWAQPVGRQRTEQSVSEAGAVKSSNATVETETLKQMALDNLAEKFDVSSPDNQPLIKRVMAGIDFSAIKEGINKGISERGLTKPEDVAALARSRMMRFTNEAFMKCMLDHFKTNTASGQQTLRERFDKHPLAQQLYAEKGLSFSALRLPGRFQSDLEDRITGALGQILSDPGLREQSSRSFEAFCNERIGRTVDKAVDKYVQGRARALGQLDGLQTGEGQAATGPGLSGAMGSLEDVLMHHYIPASVVEKLVDLRGRIPPEAVQTLSDPDTPFEAKMTTLRSFAGALVEMAESGVVDESEGLTANPDDWRNLEAASLTFLLEGIVDVDKLSGMADDLQQMQSVLSQVETEDPAQRHLLDTMNIVLDHCSGANRMRQDDAAPGQPYIDIARNMGFNA